MYDSTYLARVVDRSTVYFYQHYNHINFTAGAILLISLLVIGGIMGRSLKKRNVRID